MVIAIIFFILSCIYVFSWIKHGIDEAKKREKIINEINDGSARTNMYEAILTQSRLIEDIRTFGEKSGS